ncbi:hypothetical protein Poli38472_008386 [Pythium oligandrum]|uniref:Exocyst complex component Sec6 n=1 Tax=Pythium oligandrum TaxID=41045 RepID=A0A8K1FLZ2_PYTOL|nr:hypothetical protein Poli38472_008386 [Pythium oligandrum]|eukprot:TMW65744.1 hypothetical protein Poli38472_008386 [Pythium oligandrum]
MISLLEKEARDPVEVLRVKLKDSTETSLLNSQLLQEIKHDYVRKQDSTKGQLDAFVQAHVDEIERASTLLEMEDTVVQIVSNFGSLGQHCRKMNEDIGEKKLSSGISIARRNLRELESQMVFYEEIPALVQELDSTLDERLSEIANVYTRWQALDDWRQKMLQELRACAMDKTDELGNSKAQARILASMGPRLDGIEGIHKKILTEVWGCMHHCVEVAQYSKSRLAEAFQVMELMEKRRRRCAESKREYLDNTLQPVLDIHTSFTERCKTEISTYLTKKVDEMFRFAEQNAPTKKQKPLDAVLNAANMLLMDLEIVQSDVVPCFPNDIDIMNVFTSTYNTLVENEISKQCSQPEIGIAERLQLVQWIEYYNTEIIKYKRARASIVLEQTAQMLVSLYLDQIQGQIHMWVTNIWKRDEERIIGIHGEIQSTRPNDIVNILKSQISIGQEWLTGRLVGRVVNQCLEALMDQLKSRYESLALKVNDIEVETLCSFINDTDVLQSKCPELVEEISFAERDPEEKEAFDAFMGDGLDTTSTEIVKLAVTACELLVTKIFNELEQDTTRLWFSKKWDEGEPVVENLLATLEDYYTDLRKWISGSFFFSKLIRQCLDRCISEYIKRLLIRTHALSTPASTATIVENDIKNVITFFSTYASDLRHTGLRTADDIKKQFVPLDMIADALKGTAPEVVPIEYRETVNHVRKLMRSTSSQEAAVSKKKSKDKDKEKSKEKDKEKIKEEKEKAKEEKAKEKEKEKERKKEKAKEKEAKAKEKKNKKDKDAGISTVTKEAASRESSFPEVDGGGGFEVQSLNMSDFLGGSS